MNHRDHVALLRPAQLPAGGVWADLGSGDGAFTLALGELVGPTATVYAVDRDRKALDRLQRAWAGMFPGVLVHTVQADLAGPLPLPPLNGVIMANALHYFRDKAPLLRRVADLLTDGGRLLLVEYNVDEGNMWVPYPLTFDTYRRLAPTCGFSAPRLLATRPSSFLTEFYSAEAFKLAPSGAATMAD